jgi:RNase P/RNase MRP subunit POP5
MAVKADRKRYILFEVISNKEHRFDEVKEAVTASSQRILGELGTSEASLRFLPEFWKRNRGVLVTNQANIPKMKLVLALTKKVSGHDIIIRSIKVFGTLRKIKSGT